MTLLLDTHVLLWWLSEDDRLTSTMRAAIADPRTSVVDGVTAGALPRHHADPFDRVLIAQAARRRLIVVTADRRFADYDVLTLTWSDGRAPWRRTRAR